MKILLIEDDPKVVKIVTAVLEAKWFEADLISTAYGEEGVELVKKESPEIVIIDLMLPDISGFEVLQKIRGFSDVLVVVLTSKGEEDNRIRGLQEGADDYVVKPFSPEELVARMKALIRRREMTKTRGKVAVKPSAEDSKDRLSIDLSNRTVTVGGSLVKMDPDQYELFRLLVTNKGVALSKQALLKQVFPEKGNDIKIVDVFINRIKEKLEENPNNPKIIIDDGTTGYKFVGSCSIV
ncbi:response regulator transcription factor [Chloroflexota bacterium]